MIPFLLLFLPAFLLRFQLGSFPTNALDLLLAAAILASLPAAWRARRELFKLDAAGLGALLLLLGGTLSLFVTPDLRAAAGLWKSWLAAPIFIFFLLRAASQEERERTLAFAGIGAAAVALFGLGELAFNSEESWDGRLLGPFSNANEAALLFGPLAVFLFFRARESCSFLKSWRLALAGILLVGLILTRSYGGFLGIAAGLAGGALLLFFQKNSGRRAAAGILAALLLGGGALAISEAGSAKFRWAFSGDERSPLAVRLELWRVSGALLRESPALGVGFGGFGPALRQRGEELLGRPAREVNHEHPHQLFLATWLFTGAAGLAGLLLLLGAAAREIWQRKDTALAGFFLVILFHGLLDTSLWRNDLALLFFAGAALAARKNPSKK